MKSNVESLCDSFNLKQYTSNYQDLKNLNQKDALKHYNRFGKNEGRTDKYTYKSHPYYTHQPFLKEILKNTSGDILECGCGDGSTLFIKECIKGTDRKLVTLESDTDWLNKYTYLHSELHQLYPIDATNDDTDENAKRWVDFIDSKLKNTTFEVVFIDCSPWLSRKHIFIHDFDYFPNKNLIGTTVLKENLRRKDSNLIYEKIQIDMEPNFKLYYPPFEFFVGETGPPTLVFSKVLSKIDFDNLIEIIDKNIPKYYN